jgi:hypothetical protein
VNLLLIIGLVLVVLAVFGGGWGMAAYGPVAWSPLGVILLILLVLWLMGYLR